MIKTWTKVESTDNKYIELLGHWGIERGKGRGDHKVWA